MTVYGRSLADSKAHQVCSQATETEIYPWQNGQLLEKFDDVSLVAARVAFELRSLRKAHKVCLKSESIEAMITHFAQKSNTVEAGWRQRTQTMRRFARHMRHFVKPVSACIMFDEINFSRDLFISDSLVTGLCTSSTDMRYEPVQRRYPRSQPVLSCIRYSNRKNSFRVKFGAVS